MPTYEYACKNCGEHLEVVQSFTDDALTTCPACGGSLRKVFGSIGISFKGSGFYKTDSRSTSSAGAGSSTKSSSSETSSPSSSTSSSESSSSAASSTPASSSGSGTSASAKAS